MYADEFPLAYHITWRTYGTWLPGDARGWLKKGDSVVQSPDPDREAAARNAMIEAAVILEQNQRNLVDETIVKHCEIRNGYCTRVTSAPITFMSLSALRYRDEIRTQFKTWCSRRLSEAIGLIGPGRNGQRRWFSEKGDVRWIDAQEYLESAIRYVNELQ